MRVAATGGEHYPAQYVRRARASHDEELVVVLVVMLVLVVVLGAEVERRR